jgi:integrase/recombinase XerD
MLARDEVVRFLKAVSDLQMRTTFIAIYAAGLRVSAAVEAAYASDDVAPSQFIIKLRILLPDKGPNKNRTTGGASQPPCAQ